MLLLPFSTQASHLVGGNVGYEYLGPSTTPGLFTYRILLTVYVNCDSTSAIPFPNANETVGIYEQDIPNNPMGGGNKPYETQLVVTLVDTALIEPEVASGCGVGQGTCIIEGQYEGTIDLPINFNGYQVYWYDCCRNGAIDNLDAPGGTGFAFHAYIPPTLVDNSSPTFGDVPVPFICVGDTTTILNTAFDPDGDLLTFSFVEPLTGQGNPNAPNPLNWPIAPVTYNVAGGYSFANPFGPGGGAFIDGATGLTQYYIPNPGNYVIAVEIREFRNGNLIGVTRRDLQLLAINCPPNAPPNVASTGTNQTIYTIEEGDQLCIDIDYADLNGDSITLTAAGNIFDPLIINPSATITQPVDGDSVVQTQFCWQTACGQAQAAPYLFTVSVTDDGCPPKTTNEVFQVFVNPATAPTTITGPPIVCEGETATYSTDVIPGATYNWSITNGTINSGQGTNTISVTWGSTGAGLLSVSSTSALGCPSTQIDLNITVLATPLAEAGNDTAICMGDSAQLGGAPTANGGANITWTPATGLSDPNVANPMASPAATTTYYVTTDEGLSCNGLDSVTITIGTTAMDAGPDEIICIGDTVQLGASGGTSYTWTPTTGLSDPNIANPLAFPTVTTTYIVSITDALGCSGIDSLTVTVNPLPIADAGPDTAICDGSPIVIGGSPTGPVGSNYNWTPIVSLNDPTIANPTASPVINTTYIVTVSDANGCVNTDTAQVNISTPPPADAGNDTTICEGACANLSATGGVGFSWTPTTGLNDPNIANPIACPTTTTQYIVTVTDAAGCTNTDTVIVFVNPAPVVDPGNDISICIGATTTLGGSPTGPVGATYAWTPAATLNDPTLANPDATPTVTTTYIVVVTDGNGCTSTDSMIVTVNPLPTADAGPDTIICDQSSVVIGGAPTGPVGATYAWTPAGTLNDPSLANPTATPTVSPTTYTVTVTDGNGCVDTDDVQVTLTPAPTVIASNDTAICAGDSAQLGASGAVTYTWTPMMGLSDPNIANPMASPATTTMYFVTGTDASGCTNIDSVLITVNPLPNADAGLDEAICIGDSVQLQASGGTVYAWTPTTDLSDPNISNPFASPTTTTQYFVTVTDGNGCSSVDSVTVTVNPLPVADAGPDTTICPGTSVDLGGTPTGPVGSTFLWSPGATLNDPSLSNPTATPAGNTTYTVTVTDANGCVDTDVVDVVIAPAPNAVAGLDTTICAGDSVQLVASGGIAYSWTPVTGLTDPNIANPMAGPAGTTDYIVTVTDAAGCTATDTASIIVNPLPPADAGLDVAICIGDSVQLQATGGTTYAWTPTASLSDPNIDNPFASPTTTTQYFVTVTDGNGCAAVDSVTVTVNPLPVADAGPDTTVCDGTPVQIGGTPTGPAGSTFSWSPAATLDDPALSNPTATPVGNTTYVVTVTDLNGCVNTDVVDVTVSTLPPADAGVDTVICIGDSVQLQASGGVTYAWTPTTGLSDPNIANPMASPGTTTTYTVTVTDAGGCADTDDVIVTVNSLPATDAGTDQVICLGDTVNIGGTPTGPAGSTFNWVPNNDIDDNTVANPDVWPNVDTTYIVEVTDASGCINTDTVAITVNPLPLANAGPDTTMCLGDSMQFSSATGTTWTWDFGDTNGSNQQNPTHTYATGGIYTVVLTITDGNGCSNTDTATVTVFPLPVINAGNDTTICFGDSAQLAATGGVTYAWTPSLGLNDPNISNPLASPTDTTSYIVLATDGNGCSSTDTVVVNVLQLPAADAGADQWLCPGDSAALQATGGGIQFTWSPTTGLSDPNIANPMAGPTDTTNYIVTVTDPSGCSNTDTVTIIVNDDVPTEAGMDTTICAGDTITLGGAPTSVNGTTFLWTPAASLSDPSVANPQAFPSSTTTYYVTTTNDTCTNVDSVTVIVNQLPGVDAGPDVQVCDGDSIQLTATGAVTYDWTPIAGLSDPNIANPMASPSDTTLYFVTGTDANGCSNTDSVNVIWNPLPIADAGPNAQICFGDSAQLTATGGATYSWTPVTGLNDPNIANPMASPLDTTTYFVTVADTNACSSIDSVTVTVNPPPTVDAGADGQICSGDSIQLTATGGATYTWSPTVGLSDPNIAGPMASPATTTTYFVAVADTNGCTNVDSVVITVNPLPNADAGLDIQVCIGDSTQLFAQGGTSYSWSPANTLNDPNSQMPWAIPTDTTLYVVTVTDSNACVNTDSVLVVVNPLPTANAGPDIDLCLGDTAQLSASGGVNYTWSPNFNIDDVGVANPMVWPDITTDYIVTVADTNNCIAMDSLTVNVFRITIGPDTSICATDSVQLNVAGPAAATWSWSPATGLSDPNVANPWASPAATTVYTVTVTDSTGCSDQASVTVTVVDNPVAAFNVEYEPSCDGITANFTNLSTNADSYVWDFGDGESSTELDPTHVFPYGGNYTTVLTAVNANGCTDTAMATNNILTFEEYFTINVPNVFTPNNDGFNDRFELNVEGTLGNCIDLKIFNRWGQLMFQSTGPNTTWDGYSLAGVKVPAGTYFYTIQVENMEYKGSVTILE